MIPSNQLRRGNYVRDLISNEWMIIDDLTEAGTTARIINREKYPLAPGWQMVAIPIEQEVFFKLGFKTGFAGYQWARMDIDSTMEFWWDSQEGLSIQTKGSGLKWKQAQIVFVHYVELFRKSRGTVEMAGMPIEIQYGITFEGKLFHLQGGYTRQMEDSVMERRRLLQVERKSLRNGAMLNLLTFLLAVGTIGLVVVEIIKMRLGK